MLLEFGPWRPDLTDLDSGCIEATNVVPGIGAYEPQQSLVTFSAPLAERAQGAISLVDAAAGVYWFAGDRNHLYLINTITTSWSDISRLTLPFVEAPGVGCGVGFGNVAIVIPHGHEAPAEFGSPTLSASMAVSGLGVPADFGGITIIAPKGIGCPAVVGVADVSTVPPAYSTVSTERWSFAQYGDNVYATNFSDPIQVYSLASGTRFNDLGGGPPQARYLGVVKNFLVAVNTWDSVDGAQPQRVRWSGLDAPATWTVDATTQADFQDLYGDGGANQGILVGLTQADAVIIQERSVWRMTYEGLPNIFVFDMVEGIRGTPAPGSIVSSGGIAYYLGDDGFYAFDGAQSKAIGHGNVNRTFKADSNPAYYYRISSAIDIMRKLIFWSYTSNDAIDDNPDRILVYNHSTGLWALLKVDTELLWTTLSPGYTLEELDEFGDLDSLLSSLDSRQWIRRLLQLSAFDLSHSTAHFSGSYMNATIVTREMTTPNPQRFLVRETWPIVECRNAPTAVKIAVGSRKHANDSVSFAPATSMNAIGFCPQRSGDHFVRFQVSISASTVWNHAVGVDVQFTQVGWR